MLSIFNFFSELSSDSPPPTSRPTSRSRSLSPRYKLSEDPDDDSQECACHACSAPPVRIKSHYMALIDDFFFRIIDCLIVPVIAVILKKLLISN